MALKNDTAFFDALRAGLMGPTLSPEELSGTKEILAAAAGAPISWAAYMLATAYHETNHTMTPVREAYWLKQAVADRYCFRMYDKAGLHPKKARELGNTQAGDGVRYCGRGYVQLTGRANYAKAAGKLNVDLVAHPEKALEQGVAAKVMRLGMEEGWFTTRKLSNYLPGAYARARAIINGTDKAALIAGYARKFEGALTLGGWISSG